MPEDGYILAEGGKKNSLEGGGGETDEAAGEIANVVKHQHQHQRLKLPLLRPRQLREQY